MSIKHTVSIRQNGSELIFSIAQLNEADKSTNDISYHIGIISGGNTNMLDLTRDDFCRLYNFLDAYPFLKDASMERTGAYCRTQETDHEIVSLLRQTNKSDVKEAIKKFLKEDLSKSDIDVILGRKEALSKFEQMLHMNTPEPKWQEFFENNDWIFGYGLKYKYLKILQREAHVSDTDLSGQGAVIDDFLMADKFTKLVELKRPDTPLFGSDKYRNGAWQLSDELTNAVNQILAQKAEWELKSQEENYDASGNRITQPTHDPECILIIGNLNNIDGTDKERAVKFRTFELYRRNLRNIEILCYDELYERAKFIIAHE